jgi:hypothetical protein
MVTEDDNASSMDAANVDKMLKRSVKPSPMNKYSRLWDKWVAFGFEDPEGCEGRLW